MTWTPPWKPEQPTARCRSCQLEVVARTLADGQCAACAKVRADHEPGPDPQPRLFHAPARQPDFDEMVG